MFRALFRAFWGRMHTYEVPVDEVYRWWELERLDANCWAREVGWQMVVTRRRLMGSCVPECHIVRLVGLQLPQRAQREREPHHETADAAEIRRMTQVHILCRSLRPFSANDAYVPSATSHPRTPCRMAVQNLSIE